MEFIMASELTNYHNTPISPTPCEMHLLRIEFLQESAMICPCPGENPNRCRFYFAPESRCQDNLRDSSYL
jgi:hypothetical protein